MENIGIYTRPGCCYCDSAKNLLHNRGLTFVEYDTTINHEWFDEMIERSPQHTFPQVFIGDLLVGGFDELAMLDRNNKLNTTINS